MTNQQPKVFRVIWHVNAILILMAGLGAVFAISMALVEILRDSSRQRTTIDIETVDKDANEEDVWFLGQLTEVEGTSFFFIPLRSEEATVRQHGSVAYSRSASYYESRNLLFMDARGDPGRWLLPANNQLILSHRGLGSRDIRDNDFVVEYFLYEIVREDTNMDGKLDDKDERLLAMSEPDGGNYTELLDNIDVYLGATQVLNHELVVIFQRGGAGYSASVSLTERRVVREIKLPSVDSGT